VATPRHSLIGALAFTTVVVTAALGWAGWRLLEQQRVLDEQRERDQAERAADAVAAGIRGKLAEAGERLSGWVANPSSSVQAIHGAVVVATRRDAINVNPPSGLPYVPVVVDTPPAESFTVQEAIEFRGDLVRAAAAYRTLANQRDPYIRAGALLRLGRVQRKLGDLAGALLTYQQLAELGAVRTGDLPAELAGLSGQHSTQLALADHHRANEVAQRIRTGLDAGRWLITRGTAEFYRQPFTESRPASWALANALSEVWSDTHGRLPAQGYRVFTSPHGATSSVLVLWRSNEVVTAALAASTDAFFEVAKGMPVAWQLTDAEGSVIAGRAQDSQRAAARIIGDYAWTLRTWVESPALPEASSSRTILVTMMGAMLAFVWGASYFMARAIQREASVSQLRADFVAAVSHEFRSPLTAIRQMADMLDDDRVPTDERRHKYYRLLAGEAARLQRLVETLLNFGRMEAGAERYHFADVDAAALVREIVNDVEPQARESGKAIQVDGHDVDITVRADQAALSVALRNLIDNAIKYSPGEPTVWVRWCKDHDRAAICVVDRGVGIPRSEQQRIFGKFVRGRAAIEGNIRGTGVGLAIVHQIVTAHGGEIRLETEPGRGSTFTLLLPLAS
jgi:signal transduction histidine kinase